MNTVANVDDREVQPVSPADESGVDALDILLVLADWRQMIGAATLAALAAGLMLSFAIKPYFTATALILPPQQQSSSSALLSQLGSLSGLGGASSLGIKSPSEMYVGILQSRTIADALIDKFQLETLYGLKKMQDTRITLRGNTTIEAGKNGLIGISVTDSDPNRASELANAYVSQLYSMNSNLAITEAAQRRVFFDQQLEGEKKALVVAEDDLRATQQRTGLIQLSGQAQMIIMTIAQLRAQIASSEVQLQSIRSFATEQNPDVARLQGEIATMKQQLAKLENDQQRQAAPGNISVPSGRVAEDSLEYARKLREVKYHETLLDLLSRQYEAARIDEARSAPIIQVIDHAIPPDRKAGPHRSLIVIGFAVMGFVLATMAAFLERVLMRMRRVPRQAAKLHSLTSLFPRFR